MTRILASLMALLAMATFAMAAGEIDDTFNKVNKHLYGINEETQEGASLEQNEPPVKLKAKPPVRERTATTDEEQTSPTDSGFTAAAGGDDEHYIQHDDYFVQKHALDNHAWIWVDLAKMITSPTAGSKGEGEFMKVISGENIWSKYFWKTRIANKSELKLGLHVIAFNNNRQDDVYLAPEQKDQARGGGWFYAKITDMSDLYKGYVTVSGNYKVSPGNLRITMR